MKIEDGVPIPPPKIGRGRPIGKMGKLVRAMQIGNSVLCPTEKEANNVRSMACAIGIKVLQRKSREGWRVWRTA